MGAPLIYPEFSSSSRRYEGEFGYGMQGDSSEYASKTPLGQAYEDAWKSGCPIPNRVLGRQDAKTARDRYRDINEQYFRIVTTLLMPRALSEIEYALRRIEPRLDHEKIDLDFEAENVPAAHTTRISPLSHIKGYGLVRIYIEQTGRGADRIVSRQRVGDLIIVEQAHKSQDALEFLAKVGESVIDHDARPEPVLRNILSQGNLEEERTYETFDKLATILQDVAPNLWSIYDKLDEKSRSDLGIINFRKMNNPDPRTLSHYTSRPLH